MSANSFDARSTLQRGRRVVRDLPAGRGRGLGPPPVQPEGAAGEPAPHRGRREHHRRPHPRARRLGPQAQPEQGDPVHAGPRDHAGLHRRALRRRPRHHARGRQRPRRRPGQDQPARPGRDGHRPLGHRRLFGTPDAFEQNVELEYGRNRERYQFLRWGQTAFDEFKVVPPGTGIVHQVNIEHLARVVMVRGRPGLPRHPASAPTPTPPWSTASACSAGASAASRPRPRCSASRSPC